MNKKILAIGLLLLSAPFNNLWAQRDTSDANRLDEVVVTGTRSQVSRDNVPMTITVVGREQIEESSESALLPVLSEHVPGLFVSERGVTGFGVSAGGAGAITIRGIGGSNNTQTLVLIDGHPQFMGIMGHPLPDAYVASDVEKVEVVRGPASILYGTNAMGGVINIITRRQKTEGWNTNARVMAGSFNTQKYMVNTGVKKDKFDGIISVNHDRTDGHRDNSDFFITNGYANLGYNISKHLRVSANTSLASFEAQNPGSVTIPMFDNRVKIFRGVASASIENNYDKLSGAFTFFYNWGDHEVNDGYTTGGSPRDFRYHSTDENYGLMLFQTVRLMEGNMITVGADYKDYGGHAWNRFLDGRPDVSMVDTSIYEVAGYAVVQQNILKDKLTLSAGLRLEHNEVFGNQWVPQVGIAYRPATNTVVKGSIAKGFRSPTILEMFMWAPANPNLLPEEMINYEVSVGQAMCEGRVSFELTGFIADGKNLIQTQMIDGRPRNVNAGEFLNKGGELAVDWAVTKNLRLHTNYSYLHMETPVLYAPKQQVFVSANYHLNKWLFSAGMQVIDNLYLVTGANPVKESYALVNAKVSYRLARVLTLFVKGENLTDRDYQIMDGFPMPGITLFGGLNIALNY